MANVINFISELGKSKSATLIGLNNYKSEKTGEVANYVINVNISVNNAKQNDLKTLQNVSDADLQDMTNKSENLVKRAISIDTLKLALSEMLTSAIKNLNPDLTKRTAQSQGQTDAYIQITPAIKFHKENRTFHIFGQAISKVVVVPGVYETVDSADKTVAKNLITKVLNLRAGKYRNFILPQIESSKMNGEQFDINC
jgi:hypothetical protein